MSTSIIDSEAAAPGVQGPATVTTTDPHRSKIATDDPRLSIGARPQGRRLKRGTIMALAFTLLGLTMMAMVLALQPQSKEIKKSSEPLQQNMAAFNLPEAIRNAPDNAALTQTTGTPASPGSTDLTDPRTLPPEARGQQNDQAAGGYNQGPYSKEQLRQNRIEQFWKARSAGVYANVEGFEEKNSGSGASPGQGEPSNQLIANSLAAAGQGAQQAKPPALGGGEADQNMQERKNDFMDKTGAKNRPAYLSEEVEKPLSPYEVKAGTVIPTALISGINSDLPGQVVGQVSENVYDTVSGNYLLIPQGSRVIAAYDSMVAWGQDRVLVCWNRLIRPDGSSIGLQCMPGVDRAGYAGFADDVDNHWWRIISGVALGSLVGATATASQGSVRGFNPSIPQLFVAGAAADLGSATQQITRKNINIQPTITIRPGFSVNVLVSKDIVFPGPYRGGQ